MPGAYREHAPPRGLEEVVACVWTSHDEAVRVLPDACVDVVWSGGRLVVAGPATRAVVAPATPGQPRVGMRFRVGAAGAALGVPADELLDLDVPLSELWGRRAVTRIADRIAAAPTPEAAAAALVAGIAGGLPEERAGDRLVRAAVVAVSRDDDAGARELGRAVALSERQLLRRFKRAVGYGPRTLARVQRLQRFLTAATASPATPLARLAAEAGYADQAHLARECRVLAGVPPSALVAAGATPAGDPTLAAGAGASDSFKTPTPTRATLHP